MRKNAPRKWIHAILDLLPLFVIPIFAININQKSVEPISITVGGDYVVKNKYETNEVNTIDDLQVGKLYHFNELNINYDSIDGMDFIINIVHVDDINLNTTSNNPVVDESLFSYYDANINNVLIFNANYHNCWITYTNLDSYATVYYEDFNEIFFDLVDFYLSDNVELDSFKRLYTYDVLSDLPESSTFNVLEYVYEDVIVYDNTDIGSQFLYSIYKPVNDYFNFNNLFNMNDVWNWIQLNLFSGSTPLPVFIVWNIILYEFFIDMIFLLYSVFMFIIDFATNCLERPFNKVR